MPHVHEAPPTFVAFVLSWTAMMSVMMAPTVAPWIVAFHRFATVPSRGWRRASGAAMFALGYFVAWMLFGIGLALLRAAIPLPAGYGWLVLLVAGLFQFSALKQACLSHCRNPLSFLLARWTSKPVSGFRLGLAHGRYCIGCCWALMLTMFAVSALSAWWMAALAAITVAEQISPWGATVRVAVGVTLLIAGLGLL